MLIKTSELIDSALDYAVAKSKGLPIVQENEGVNWSILCNFSPRQNWLQGGAIIEEEGIRIHRSVSGVWWASAEETPQKPYQGSTPLIAAMRCCVASKIGDTVEIPDELLDLK